jgi:rRNA processing protein Gar1
VGVILHRAKSGRLIVRLTSEIRTGAMTFDGDGKKLGKAVELIGPVKAPYASLSPSTSRPGKSGDPVFVEG